MGDIVDPNRLTASGERCLRRVSEISSLGLPPGQFVAAAITAVEIHVSTTLARLIVVSGVSEDRFGRSLIEHIDERFTYTWVNRVDWLSKGFDIQLRNTQEYAELDIAISVRNAVAHGDGQLTDHQTQSLKKVLILRGRMAQVLNVDARGRLTFASDSSLRAEVVMRSFIQHFDKTVIAGFPDIRGI